MGSELAKVREERKKALREKGKSIIYNSRVEHLDQGEKYTHFFFKKAFQKREPMQTIFRPQGEVEGDDKGSKILLYKAFPRGSESGKRGNGGKL